MRNFRSSSGLSLIMLIFSIFAIGLTSAGLTLSAFWLFSDKAVTVTEQNMRQIGIAISNKNIKGAFGPRHYEQDVLALPNAFTDLITQPGGVANCALNTQSATLHGWCGPYLVNSYSGQNLWADGWGRDLIYDKNNRRIRSMGPNGVDNSGGGDDLVQTF